MKKTLSLLVVALMLLSVLFASPVKAESDRINYLKEQKIVEGNENGDLMLSEPITRAALAKIVVYAIGKEDAADQLKNVKSMFVDMNVGGWANGYANVAATEGIMNGYPGGIFAPNDNVTYEQAIKMLTVVANGKDLSDAEKPAGVPWATPYITKASSLGILKHLNISDFKKDATREEVFDILYEVLQLKKDNKTFAFRGMVTELDKNNGARVKILRTDDKSDLKVGDSPIFSFISDINAQNYLGRVIDFNFDGKNLIKAEIAREYEVVEGSLEFGRDGQIYMNESKRGYIVDETEKSEDRLVNIIHNGENYSLSKFEKEKVDYAQITIHNSKVVFIRSFTFEDIAPVADIKNNDVYVIRDTSPRKVALQNLSNIMMLKDGLLTTIDLNGLEPDDVLHIYNKDMAIATRNKLSDVHFKIVAGELVINGKNYPLPDRDNFRAVLNVDFEAYDSIYPKRSNDTLNAMQNKKNVIALDMYDRVVLVRGDLNEMEETMIVDALTASEIRLRDKNNKLSEHKDNLAIEIKEGDKVLKLANLNRSDLVYVFSNDGKISKIAKIANAADDFKLVDKNKDGFVIDNRPSRGRYALVTIAGKTYELDRDSLVLVNEGDSYVFSDIDHVKNTADTTKQLRAHVITTADFNGAKTGAKLPLSNRDDLVSIIVFDNYQQSEPIKESKVVMMENGFDIKLDRELRVVDNKGEKFSIRPSKNASLEVLSPGEIVKLNLGNDGAVVSAEKLINTNMRTYTIDEVLVEGKTTTLKFTRVDNNEKFTKVLDKDCVIFGELKSGATMRMHVTADDIDVLEIVK
ncbi:MAG: S-layer homology domain-containing protein [Ezakiella sp.]|nr:S-layer homology domain-containing protein [Ezakiella sp.]